MIVERGRVRDKIRRGARKLELSARKSRQNGLWYISDDNNLLVSPEVGLDDQEALSWLKDRAQQSGHPDVVHAMRRAQAVHQV